MAEFTMKWRVRFADTDPAAIVFYPRYFEMVNGIIEDWFAHLGYPWDETIKNDRLATPTVHLDADFQAPTFMGEELDLKLNLINLGRTSCTVRVTAYCNDEKRFTIQPVLVYVNLDNYNAQPFPANLRQKMEEYLIT